MTEKSALEAAMLCQTVKPLFAGRGPDIQGAALAELVAIWLAGHHPDVRDISLDLWLRTVRELVPVCEKEMFGPKGWT